MINQSLRRANASGSFTRHKFHRGESAVPFFVQYCQHFPQIHSSTAVDIRPLRKRLHAAAFVIFTSVDNVVKSVLHGPLFKTVTLSFFRLHFYLQKLRRSMAF